MFYVIVCKLNNKKIEKTTYNHKEMINICFYLFKKGAEQIQIFRKNSKKVDKVWTMSQGPTINVEPQKKELN